MKKKAVIILIAVLAAAALLIAKPWEPGVYVPAGPETGAASLDGQVLAVLQEVCDPKAGEMENLAAVYDWVCNEITYRPGTADISQGFTDELVNRLAEELLNKRKGNCDGEAALMAALLRRMGYEARVVTGEFLRGDGIWVDHAWVLANAAGEWRHFDPLYGRAFAGEPRSAFARTDADMEATHRWN